MSSYTVESAMPTHISLGKEDKSARAVVLEDTPRPQHVALIPIFAKSGPLTPVLCSGIAREKIFGAATFDERGVYATHSTPLANQINTAGNTQAYLRMIPDDIGPRANIQIFADVLETALDEYQRLPDGSFALDPISHLPIVETAGGIPAGLKIKFGIRTCATPSEFETRFGAAELGVGTMTNDDTGDQSVIYPLWEGAVPYLGVSGNLTGVRMWAPTEKGLAPVNRNTIVNTKVYPYRFMFTSKDNAANTSRPVVTSSAEQTIDFTFRPETTSVTTGKLLSIHDALTNNYAVEATGGLPEFPAPMSTSYVYDEYVQELLNKIMLVEKVYADANSDITSTASGEDMWLMNMLGAESSYGVPYTAVQIVGPTGGGIRLTSTADHFAMSGSDGTLTNAVFDTQVATEIPKFGDAAHIYTEIMKYPVSDFYDTGYSMATKRACAAFIAERKDTFIALSPHVWGEPPLSASDRSSRAVLLAAYLQAYPESEYFGTGTCRGVVVGSSGYLINSPFSARKGIKGRQSLAVWLAVKAARYMGASNRRWKSVYRFESEGSNIIDNFTDIDVTFTPTTVRQKDWAAGMIYPQIYDEQRYFFAGLQTVFADDTSSLNGYFAVKAACYLEKVGYRAWRHHTNNQSDERAVFEAKVQRWIENDIVGLFDDKFIISVRCYHTLDDDQRGYSFHTQITLGADPAKTVMVFNLTVRRKSDMLAEGAAGAAV